MFPVDEKYLNWVVDCLVITWDIVIRKGNISVRNVHVSLLFPQKRTVLLTVDTLVMILCLKNRHKY